MNRHQLQDTEDKNLIEKGFTLVELLIVIVIMGILAGIVVFAVSNLSDDAQTNSCKTEKSTVETAAEAFKAKTGSYPTMAQLVNGTGGTPVNGKTVEALLKTDPSARLSISNTGVVTATANGDCVGKLS